MKEIASNKLPTHNSPFGIQQITSFGPFGQRNGIITRGNKDSLYVPQRFAAGCTQMLQLLPPDPPDC